MDHKKFGNKYFVRLDKGEEIVASLQSLCQSENIKLGYFQGFGAVNKVELGLFKTVEKEYSVRTLEGDFEITSLLGNISTKDDETYLHMHVNLSDIENTGFGGHLNNAYVSATVEIFIEAIDGLVKREFDPEIGLNLYKFD
ncbi:PPC domain-containing DNA-binding protein [Alkalibacter mobilis]|uniref:PPC domain-containing DNA-binding protein n=1 Tax=Alkalibacter mobilis TaxID=2787712 RepID=UPI00189DC408|nr:PPC domain-containing DNA-binding protein [Alkalibacter mobilis]MBF7095945.1 DNA-binding protein [Alkalibacter mobilis]